MRALFLFGKEKRLRFVSHLDLQRFMQMALRRTDLPVAYSQGFNPHPSMAFASALAMGWTSEYEILDVKMSEPIEGDYAFRQFGPALPPDLPLYAVRMVDDRHPAMMAQLALADYRITLPAEAGPKIAPAIDEYLKMDSCIALRKTKSGEKPTDIRPMSVLIDYKQTEVAFVVEARLALTEQATLKPDLLLSTWGADPTQAEIRRLALLGRDASGRPKRLLDL